MNFKEFSDRLIELECEMSAQLEAGMRESKDVFADFSRAANELLVKYSEGVEE